jgi:fructoselysine 3-epimerase
MIPRRLESRCGVFHAAGAFQSWRSTWENTMIGFSIGCMTNACIFWPLEKALKCISEVGIRHIEIMCDRPHLYPDDYGAADRKKLKKSCQEQSLKIAALDAVHVSTLGGICAEKRRQAPPFFPDGLGNEPMFTSVPRDVRRARIDYVKKCIDLAGDLEVDLVETYAGKIVGDPEEAWKHAQEGIAECIDHAARRRVHILLELYDELVNGRPDEALQFQKEMNSPWLAMCVDLSHIEVGHYDVPATIRKLGDSIRHCHIADIKRRKHFHLICGQGDMDFKTYFRALNSIGFKGCVCLEVYPYADDPQPAVRESYECLNRIASEVSA